MLVIFDFLCEGCNKVFESLADRDDPKAECPDCSKSAKKLLSAPSVHLDGTDPGFPGAYSKWARRHEKHGKVRK